MGFAGQIFAARVAVGLALPSPSAFSEAGQMVGGFAAKMYQNLHSKSSDAAKQRLADANKNLKTAKQQLMDHSKTQQSYLENIAKTSIERQKKAFKGLGSAGKAGAGAIKGLQATLGKTKLGGKLFPNAGKDISDGQRYSEMFDGFVQSTRQERIEVMRVNQARVEALKQSIQIATAEHGASSDKVKDLKNELAQHQVVQRELGHYHKESSEAAKAFDADGKKYTKNVVKREKEKQKAIEDVVDELEQGVTQQKKWGQVAGAVAGEMKTGFNNALRESVSVLTAFYYKLSENSQQLIEFERELMNANSVFRITNSELFNVGETVIQFGQRFGMEMQNGAAGLYQLASAGLTANEAMELLPHTLKLSMAVQGDHNTISKLTAQTIFGFGMEMSQASEVTDKFAHAIQKSLIEYQDLSSAVKFALPFFTTTGQSIDQLLGALAVLTNRALEAGIAGRGLRQGLAELAESVGDNTAAFRKLGVEVTNQQGDMLQLTEIAANFAAVLEEGVINDTELLTMLIEDLNVRGATAFVHLVQASDEFTAAVKSSEEAGGELDEMVKIQNASISAQIQILKNNVEAIFMMRDANYEGTEFMNAFHEAVATGVQQLKDLLVVETEQGMVLTDMGKQFQEIAVTGVGLFVTLLEDLIPLMEEFIQKGVLNVELLKVYLIPLQLVVTAIDLLGPGVVKVIIAMRLFGSLLPIQSAALLYYSHSMKSVAASTEVATAATARSSAVLSTHPMIRMALIVTAVAAGMWLLFRRTEAYSDGAFKASKFTESLVGATKSVLGVFKGWGEYLAGGFMERWFVISKFIEHFFMFLAYQLRRVVDWFAPFGASIINMGKLFIDLINPISTLKQLIIDFFGYLISQARYIRENGILEWIAQPFRDMADALTRSAKMLGSISSGVGKFKLLGDGGMVRPTYAANGAYGAGPYIVGERGPELFVPSTTGRVVPNKDLNTQRVKNMIQDAFTYAPRQGAAGVGHTNTLIVSSLNVGSADLRQTRLGVDVFG